MSHREKALLRKISGYHWANVDPEERARTRAELRDMLSASAEPSAPKFPRVQIVRAHKHTCASCKDGAEHGQCDCGAVVDGTAVPASAPVERDELVAG